MRLGMPRWVTTPFLAVSYTCVLVAAGMLIQLFQYLAAKIPASLGPGLSWVETLYSAGAVGYSEVLVPALATGLMFRMAVDRNGCFFIEEIAKRVKRNANGATIEDVLGQVLLYAAGVSVLGLVLLALGIFLPHLVQDCHRTFESFLRVLAVG